MAASVPWFARILRWLDRALPETPDEQDRRLDGEERDPEAIARRRRRLRISTFEKRGKGGFR